MPVNGAWSFEQTLNGRQLGFTIGTILATFDLRVTPMLPIKFQLNWPFGSGEEANNFSKWLPWRPSWISDWHDFSYFWSTSHPNVSYKFGVNWPFGAGEEAKYWSADFSYFWSTSCPNASYQVSSHGLSVQERKRKIDFQDGCQGAHPGFPIGTILAIFDLQVTPMLPCKFGVNWSFGLGEEAKNRFSRFPIGTILAIFYL